MERTFENFLSSQMCGNSVKSYLSYARNAFKKFSGEKDSIFNFLEGYTLNSRELYCEYLISLLNAEIQNPGSSHNKKTLRNYKSAIMILEYFVGTGIYPHNGTKRFSNTFQDVAYTDDDLVKNFLFRLETQDRYYATCCFPCRLFRKIFSKNHKYIKTLKDTINNTEFIINTKQDCIALKQLGLLVITANGAEVWHGNNGAVDNVYTEVYDKGISQGFSKSTARALSQLSLDHKKPLVDIVTNKINNLPELKKLSDALLVYKSNTGLKGSKLATEFYNNIYQSLNINDTQLLNDMIEIYNDVQLVIMDKRYNSSKNSN